MLVESGEGIESFTLEESAGVRVMKVESGEGIESDVDVVGYLRR